MIPKEFEEIIKNKEFSRSLQGYNPQQVDRYIKKLSSYYWEVHHEKCELEKKVSEYDKQDKYVRQALIRVEETSEEIKSKAIMEAEKIRQQATEEAKQIKYKALKEAEQIKEQAVEEGKVLNENLIKNCMFYEEQTKGLIGALYYTVRSKFTSLQDELSKELDGYTKTLENIIQKRNPSNKENNKIDEIVDKWKSQEEELLVGYVLKAPIKDREGNVVVSKSTVVTPGVIKLLIEKELYGELITTIGDEINELGK